MRATFSSLAVLTCLAVATPAAAQGDIVTPTETQFKLYQEGAEAYGAGEYSKAVDLFRASLRLGELNITYLNLGRALFKLGDCQEASTAYAKALTAPKIANPTPMQVLTKVEEYKKDLAECPAILTVECNNPAAELWVDGTGPVPCDGSAMTMLPGDHTVEVRLGDEQELKSVTLASMESRTLTMAVGPKGPVGPAGPTEPVVVNPVPAKEPNRVLLGATIYLVTTGSADVTVSGFGASSTEGQNDETNAALNLLAAYRIAGGFHLGVSFAFYPGFKLVDDDVNEETVSDATQGDLNAVALVEFPLGALVPFVLFEGGATAINDDDQDETLRGFNVGGGLGVKYKLSDNFALGADVRASYYTATAPVSASTDQTFTEGGGGDFEDLEDFGDAFGGDADLEVTGTRVLVNLGAILSF